jgi:integrase/recombinase XerD
MNDATTIDPLPIQILPTDRLLTAAEFQKLADVPPEVEWFANLGNHHTRRAYENAVKDFMRFAGIQRPEEFRIVTRAHLIAWRDELSRRGLGGATIRQKSCRPCENCPLWDRAAQVCGDKSACSLAMTYDE